MSIIDQLTIRPFTPEDLDSCLEIFDSNMPMDVLPNERGPFKEEVEQQQFDYFIVEDANGTAVACGGFHRPSATLCWGLVRRSHHRQYVGSFLLRERLLLLHEARGDVTVKLDTTQHARPFFERFGFITIREEMDHYGPGMHRFDMELKLDETCVNRLNSMLLG